MNCPRCDKRLRFVHATIHTDSKSELMMRCRACDMYIVFSTDGMRNSTAIADLYANVIKEGSR